MKLELHMKFRSIISKDKQRTFLVQIYSKNSKTLNQRSSMYTYAALNRFFGEESENNSSEAYKRFLDFLSDDKGCDEPSSVELLNKRNILTHKF
jgi:hypothetical protein